MSKMDYTQKIRQTIGLLSSMVRGRETHSKRSESAVKDALDALDKIQSRRAPTIKMNEKAMKKMDEQFKLQIKALDILTVIVAEFESDPLSVQCFDLRLVKDAKRIVKRSSILEEES